MTPTDITPDQLERFWAKVDKTAENGCWNWTAGKIPQGYGQFNLTHKTACKAHRFAYIALVGPIPDGLVLDHLCRNRACVNPDHLEPVTQGTNARRGDAGAHNASKTHCPAGHPYSDANTEHARRGRRCRTCREAYYAANRDEILARRYARRAARLAEPADHKRADQPDSEHP